MFTVLLRLWLVLQVESHLSGPVEEQLPSQYISHSTQRHSPIKQTTFEATTH